MSEVPKIFISWSMSPSEDIAMALQKWLRKPFPDSEFFVSSADIEAGTLPMERLRGELTDSSCGILVVTKANQERPWINFEAGSLLHTLDSDRGRVIPLLVDLKPEDVRGPMGLLQMVSLTKKDLLDRLIPSLCHAFGITDIDDRKETGEAFVGKLMKQVDAARDSTTSVSPAAPDIAGMLAEILSTVRSIVAPDTSSLAYATVLTDLARRIPGAPSVAALNELIESELSRPQGMEAINARFLQQARRDAKVRAAKVLVEGTAHPPDVTVRPPE